MIHVRPLPRVLTTWGLMFLTVIVSGVRPSCICADGTLCAFCPKLVFVPAASQSTELATGSDSCATKSCCRKHAPLESRSDLAASSELAGFTCNDRDCLTIQPVSPAITSLTQNPISVLRADLALSPVSRLPVGLHGDIAHSERCVSAIGPPPNLIVLFQRWLI